MTDRDPIAHLGECLDILSRDEERSGAAMFLGRPDRWYEAGRWRCPNDHVSARYLKTESRGAICLACDAPVCLTFPEDIEGVLIHPALATCGARSILGGQCRRPRYHPRSIPHSDPGYHDAWQDEDPQPPTTRGQEP